MENASKALLIAASVLIVIALIAVGINILGSTSGITNNVGDASNAMGVAVFNSQFTDYSGTQSGAQVRALLSKVIANNTNSSHNIAVNGGNTTAAQIESIRSRISVTSSYTVTMGYDSTGYVTSITIS